MITFDEKSHTYKCSKTGRELISATTLIGKYKKPFDKMENATRVANREGLDVEFVLDMWEKEKNRACDYGTNIHKVMEDYLTEGVVEEEHESLYISFNKWNHIFKKFPTLLCEEKLHDLDGEWTESYDSIQVGEPLSICFQDIDVNDAAILLP